MKLDYSFIRNNFWDICSYLPCTFKIVIGTLLISVPFSALFTLIKWKKIPVLNQIIGAYMSIIRGTPIILQLYLIYYKLPYLLADIVEKFNPEYNVYLIESIWYAYFGLALSTIVLLTDAFSSAVESVDRGQLEAAYTVGCTSWQACRRIILPQTLATVLPVLGNICISTIKNSSLAFTIGVVEITARAKVLGSGAFHYVEAYLTIFVIYIVVITVIEYLFGTVEKRLVRYKCT